jgi:hypothetical protein
MQTGKKGMTEKMQEDQIKQINSVQCKNVFSILNEYLTGAVLS